MGLGQMISGLIIGFIFKWDLALVTLATSAITFVPAAVYTMSSLDRRTKMLAAAYGEDGDLYRERNRCADQSRPILATPVERRSQDL